MYTRFSIHWHTRELEIIKEFLRLYKTKVTGKATVSVEKFIIIIFLKNFLSVI